MQQQNNSYQTSILHGNITQHKYFSDFNRQYCMLSLLTSFTEFALRVCVCIYHPDDECVDVETCRRDTSDK